MNLFEQKRKRADKAYWKGYTKDKYQWEDHEIFRFLKEPKRKSINMLKRLSLS